MYWNLRYLEDSENGFADTGEFPLLGETKRLLNAAFIEGSSRKSLGGSGVLLQAK